MKSIKKSSGAKGGYPPYNPLSCETTFLHKGGLLVMDYLIIGSIILTGVIAVIAAIFEWEGFFNNPQVKIAVRVFGREGARIAYIILGVLGIVFGIMAGRIS
jgi:hypothetical protein